ncbi:MAG: hypothetical protein KF850_29715 [Labilithrix sp.]|nr:hypothetical protein [Labilithrix sp.]
MVEILRGRSLCALLLALSLFALSLLSAAVARAEGPLDPKAVPEPLRPWTGWVLHGRADLCPTLHGVQGGEPQCTWPARLDLVLDEKRGSFRQTWHADARRSVPLPGDDKRWPLDVTVDGKRAVVVPRDGAPSVELEPGDHVVSGSFAWDSLPESIQVPPQTALLELSLRGKKIDQPNRDAKGTVWLQKTLAAEEGERLDFVVFRRVADEVPVLLTTRIVINVAGRNREVLLGKMLPKGFLPMALESQLPARVEPDSRLRVQARPGTWTIEVVARSEGPVHEIKRPVPEGPWREGEEVWVFDARTNLRLVDVSGVSAIDPQQTSLPEDWKRLPAYPLGLGDTLRFAEKRRGDAEPPPDHLTLDRTLWLDFDGRGLTASDTLSGNLRRASRLEMLPPTVLGRVAIGGKDQFITHLEGDAAKTGVEVRQGELSVSADSRVLADPLDLPAVGWNHDFHSVSATLNLPPGFRLVHATGVDDVPSTWIKHWTLLELFLGLVLAIGVWRLFGVRWGALSLVTFALTFPEAGAPKYVLVFVLIAEALVRALDGARKKAGESPPRGLILARRGAGGVRAAAATILVLVTIPFLVSHVRYGLFPALAMGAAHDDTGVALEIPGARGKSGADKPAEQAPESEGKPPMQGDYVPTDEDRDAAKEELDASRSGAPPPASPLSLPSARLRKGGSGAGASTDYRQFNANVYDPGSMVQTGPGRPRWQFTQVPLRWSGPVERSQRLHLYLLSPAMNAGLAIVRALLVIALVLRFVPVRPRRGTGAGGRRVLTFAAVAVLVGLFPRTASAQAVPPKEVLDELASRMLEKPACSPTCASSSRMLIEATKSTLHLRVEIEASAATAVPLPGSAQWSPETVLLDGKPASALMRTEDGRVWLAVEKGWHQATALGKLPDRELVQIALPLKPHRVEAQADGWRVEGIHEDGLADDNLQLTRIRGADSEVSLEPGLLPPFVRVERTLLIGLDWQVATRVVRLSPLGTAIVLDVPLLEGESVTTADVRVAGGKAQLNMPPQAGEISWRSVLDQRSPVVLTAPKSTSWTELWRLDMSPVWHAELAGVPVVHAEPSAKLPEWRPWPGETATLSLSRPDGVTGSTLTIDESTYALRPGVRSTDATLTLQLRSSRGAQHTITLPDASVLESVAIDGKALPVRQEGRKVTLPVSPGAESVVITWRMPVAMGFFFTTPAVDLGAASVNATTTIAMPEGRWVLGFRGPRLGPVVLFWSLLAVVLAVSVAIGAMRRTPIAIWQWLLLAIGLSQVNVVAGAFVVAWLHLLAWREKGELGRVAFNLRQVAIVLATVVTFFVLLAAVHQGLLGHPDMQVSGNRSTSTDLRWFTDRSEAALAMPLTVSAPMFVYRAAMLAWALWLALSIVGWLRWGFGAFASGGFWRRPPPRTPPQYPMAPMGPMGPMGPPGVAPPFPPPPPGGAPPPPGGTPPPTGG